jgi:hypothetical protein
VTFTFQAGSTTTFGTGVAEYTFSLPATSRNFSWQYGSGEFNATASYVSLFRVSANDNKFVVLTDNYAGGARYNRPEAWASGCRLRGTIEYETA